MSNTSKLIRVVAVAAAVLATSVLVPSSALAGKPAANVHNARPAAREQWPSGDLTVWEDWEWDEDCGCYAFAFGFDWESSMASGQIKESQPLKLPVASNKRSEERRVGKECRSR